MGSLFLSKSIAGAYPEEGVNVLLLKNNARNDAYKLKIIKIAVIIRLNYLAPNFVTFP
jgi:hypothetical protein